jgi:hypothetical protein
MAALCLNSLLARPPLVKAPIYDDLNVLFSLKNATHPLFEMGIGPLDDDRHIPDFSFRGRRYSDDFH